MSAAHDLIMEKLDRIIELLEKAVAPLPTDDIVSDVFESAVKQGLVQVRRRDDERESIRSSE